MMHGGGQPSCASLRSCSVSGRSGARRRRRLDAARVRSAGGRGRRHVGAPRDPASDSASGAGRADTEAESRARRGERRSRAGRTGSDRDADGSRAATRRASPARGTRVRVVYPAPVIDRDAVAQSFGLRKASVASARPRTRGAERQGATEGTRDSFRGAFIVTRRTDAQRRVRRRIAARARNRGLPRSTPCSAPTCCPSSARASFCARRDDALAADHARSRRAFTGHVVDSWSAPMADAEVRCTTGRSPPPTPRGSIRVRRAARRHVDLEASHPDAFSSLGCVTRVRAFVARPSSRASLRRARARRGARRRSRRARGIGRGRRRALRGDDANGLEIRTSAARSTTTVRSTSAAFAPARRVA